ncbi:MAG TPA: TonB-dependent receptor [Longimicrobiales bacterium]|nr:TonB-dependent receptor [Longimicrobiales bacterium]
MGIARMPTTVRHFAVFLVMTALLPAIPSSAAAQEARATGRVVDSSGALLSGVRVEEKGSLSGTLTDSQGQFAFAVSSADATLVFSLFGYQTREVTLTGAPLEVVLQPGMSIQGLEVVGTRRTNRTSVETPVAVDVIDVKEVTQASGRLEVNAILQQLAPSFNANRQSGADGSDHIDPATLRGLGPDQTLVLINGKRRHQSSNINIFGSRGRGNTGTDLNSIPVGAIERIEILRDGASAQYGSDAIAGVMNIVLKSSVDEFSGSLTSGFHNAKPPTAYDVLRTESRDGQEVQFSGNYGFRVGDEGFVNATAEYLSKDHTNRPANPGGFDIYRRQFGDAALDNFGTFVNARVPLSSGATVYAFGGVSLRKTDAYAWSRDADSDRNVPAIYPQGFDPHILSDITDQSLSMGVQTKLGEWDLDLNNTFGANRFHYMVDGTLNASLLEKSPTHFDAGGFGFSQNTTGINFTRFFPGTAEGMNVAFGAEYRIDRYDIFAGEEGSYRNYGIVQQVVDGAVVPVDVLGRPGGSQGFPGFQPANELNETRTNLGLYLDTEVDVSPKATLSGAVRYEDYSDFGSTTTAKVAGRIAVAPGLSLRASASTGFRAPSLAQIHFNTTFTDFVAGEAVDKLIARNTSPITRTLGIPPLTEEKATNFGLGFTARLGDFSATVDAYRVDIKDRIVLTGAFEDTDPAIGADLTALGVGAAQFFTNALDTKTNGLDVVMTYQQALGTGTLRTSVAANFNDMTLGTIQTSPKLAGKEDVYFGAREQHFLLASAPESKVAVGLDYLLDRVDVRLNFIRFGKVTLIDWLDTEDIYQAKTTADVGVTGRLSSNMSLTLGGANLFNTYPTQQDTETETGGLWDAVQMGFSGTLYFAKLSFRF